MKRGRFITIEGGEGAGKSTVIKFIENYLKSHDISLIVTREPGGTEIAEDIRKILLPKASHYQEKMCPITELLLYFASRAQHLAVAILPALERGQWVLCDRFTDSSYAYQGIGRGIAEETVKQVAQIVHGNLQPDFTFLLDLNPEIGFARISKSGRELDRLEVENLDFYKKVRQYYLQLAQTQKQRFRVIDADKTTAEVEVQLEGVLQEILKLFSYH